MIAVSALWLPILLSTVAVFIASSIIHMMSPWHKNDYSRLPNEDDVLAALRPFKIPPGDYLAPRPLQRADMKSPAYLEKRDLGPVFVMTVMPNGPWAMGTTFIQWLIYLAVVNAIGGCVAASALPAGADGHRVFHYVAITAFLGYAMALWQLSIWYHRSWSITIKATVDGAIYAGIGGLIFMALWPA